MGRASDSSPRGVKGGSPPSGRPSVSESGGRGHRGRQKAFVRRESVELAHRLAEPEFRDRVRLTEEDMATLDLLSKNPPRNAAAMLAALKLRIEYGYSRPKQEVEHSGTVGIVVIDPYSEDDTPEIEA